MCVVYVVCVACVYVACRSVVRVLHVCMYYVLCVLCEYVLCM